jgi:hypothetical protein
MPRITISYRRDDSLDITGRIFDRLAAHFGREAVFRDIDNIPLGVDFRKHIDTMLGVSDIILAIVGPRWIGPRSGQSRLASAADPVRLEIETALRKDKPLIPVLVSRAVMPRPDQLPESLHDFAYRNAVQVDAGQDFDFHIGRLIRAMDRMLGRGAEEVVPLAEEAEPPAEVIVDQDTLPEAKPDPILHLAVEIDDLRAANRALEEQLVRLTSARDEEAARVMQLRDEVAAALLRGEQEAKNLTQQLAVARDATALRDQQAEQAEVELKARESRIAALTREHNDLKLRVNDIYKKDDISAIAPQPASPASMSLTRDADVSTDTLEDQEKPSGDAAPGLQKMIFGGIFLLCLLLTMMAILKVGL